MNTIRVRIAAVVDPFGRWCALGASDERYNHSDCLDRMGDGEAHYWIEADLVVPQAKVVEGKVMQAELGGAT